MRPESIFQWMGKEIALAMPESNRRITEKLLLIQAIDSNAAITSMNNIAATIDQEKGASPYSEMYADVPIRQINMVNFPEKALGSFFNGFEQCFYAPVSNYIVFTNSIQSMKKFLDDIESRNVWAYSVSRKEVIQEISKPDNFSMFVHTARAWNMLYRSASPNGNL